MVGDSTEAPPARRGRTARLLVVAVAWLVAARALAYYGVLLLPRAIAAQLTLHSYLSLVLVIVTAAGIAASRLFVDEPRRRLGLVRPSGPHVIMGVLWGPIVLTLSAYLAFRIALPTLLAEIAAGGKQAAESNTGEFGRALVSSPPTTTLVWAVVITPIAEELLFRGILWSAITGLSAGDADGSDDAPSNEAPSRADDARSLPAELLDESLVLRASRGLWLRLRGGGIATLVTAAIFAALHADMPGGAGIVRIVQTACLGLALGIGRQISGSIVPGIALHAVFNLMTIAKLRKWLTGPGWPAPLPVPIVWWQIAAAAALLLTLIVGYRALRRRQI